MEHIRVQCGSAMDCTQQIIYPTNSRYHSPSLRSLRPSTSTPFSYFGSFVLLSLSVFQCVYAVTNYTAPASSGSDSHLISGLPVSNFILIIVVCVVVILICVCLFCCARSQISATTASGRVNSTDSALQAKLEAARRNPHRRDEIANTPGLANATIAQLAMRGFTQMDLMVRSSELQRIQMSQLGGGSLGGLGACKYDQFYDPNDFTGEVWATEGTREALKRSGLILDIILTTQVSMFMSGLSGIIPLCITAVLPFHKMILSRMSLSDWYGPIEQVDFLLCICISGGYTLIHLIAYILAKLIHDYDRMPSIIEEKNQYRTDANMAGTTGIVPTHTSMPISSPNLADGSLLAARGGPEPIGTPSFKGKDPNIWPLRIFCIICMLSYAWVGYQAYISCDESGGRQYGITSTKKLYWPPTAGKAPAITFLIIVILGVTAMIPIGFSLRLLALFTPRSVHPHLIRKFD